MKLFPLLPLIFMAAYIFVGVSIAIADPLAAAIAAAVLAAFVLIYFVFHKKQTVINDAG